MGKKVKNKKVIKEQKHDYIEKLCDEISSEDVKKIANCVQRMVEINNSR